MHPPGADTVLVRHGEIGVKSEQVRHRMETRLRNNIDALLSDRGLEGSVEYSRFRIRVDTGQVEAVTDAVTDAFGVVSASPALRVPPEADPICDALAETAQAVYDGGTFAVSARRAGPPEAHPFSSRDLEVRGGDAVGRGAREAGLDPEVDLDDPDVEFFVEAREEVAYVFLEKREGPGGLPLGTQDPLVAMVSGGIDSPVAAWEAMSRGSEVVPVYVDLGDFGGVDHRARALSTVADLARYAPSADMALRVVPGGEFAADLRESVEAGRMLVLRRFMLAAADELAREAGARGIVTGESVGQKSSQTTANLAVTSAAADLPVHRPLLTRDKTDIQDQARAIGTLDDSTIPAGCNRLAPEYPETRATLAQVRELEPDDLFERARAAAAAAETVDPSAV